MTEFTKEDHIDIIRQYIQEELREFQPDKDDAQELRHRVNLLEMQEILMAEMEFPLKMHEEIASKMGRPRKHLDLTNLPNGIVKVGTVQRAKTTEAPKKERGKYGKYTPEVIRRIKKLHETMKADEISKEINRKFGLNATEGSIAVLMSKQGITSRKAHKNVPDRLKPSQNRAVGGNSGKRIHSWPDEVVKYVKEAAKTKDLLEICEGLKKFGINTNPENMHQWMWKRKIKVQVRRVYNNNRPREKIKKSWSRNLNKEKASKQMNEITELKNQACEFIKTNKHIEARKLKSLIKEKFKIGMDTEFIESQKKGGGKEFRMNLVTPEVKNYIWSNRDKASEELSTRINSEFGVSLKQEEIVAIKKQKPMDFADDEEPDVLPDDKGEPDEGIIEEEMGEETE